MRTWLVCYNGLMRGFRELSDEQALEQLERGVDLHPMLEGVALVDARRALTAALTTELANSQVALETSPESDTNLADVERKHAQVSAVSDRMKT